VTTLYDILGIPEDATEDDVRRAYYRAARQIHPDVNPDRGATDAMRRLNQAWAVLGDPEARRSYDRQRQMAAPAPLSAAPTTHYEPVVAERFTRPPAHALGRLLRPSALILTVLLVIFVVTAYAGPRSNDRSPATTPVPSTAGDEASSPLGTVPAGYGTGLLDECIRTLPGYDAITPCSQHNDGMVVAEVDSMSACPAETRPYHMTARARIVCLLPAGP